MQSFNSWYIKLFQYFIINNKYQVYNQFIRKRKNVVISRVKILVLQILYTLYIFYTDFLNKCNCCPTSNLLLHKLHMKLAS